MNTVNKKSPLGLYIHIPFCQHICHYCDFAKTANYSPELVKKVFTNLEKYLNFFIREYAQENQVFSCYIGGGTPSLFTHEYVPLFEKILPLLQKNAEVTIEANPKDLTDENLLFYKSIGVNRISLGVQTFSEQGLRFLKRDHDHILSLKSIERTQKFFENITVDLIYGWPSQTKEFWQKDLDILIKMGLAHVSLYNLIYEAGTPIGRAFLRGKIKDQSDDFHFSLYQEACERLNEASYIHEEVSNWGKPGFLAQHNQLYWTDSYFMGVGSGAWGYLPGGEVGLRYQFTPHERNFARASSEVTSLQDLSEQGLIFIEDRTKEDWLVEYVGSSLRTFKGTDLNKIKKISGHDFVPTPTIRDGINSNKISITDNHVRLISEEWFREQTWCLELLSSLKY